MIYYILTTWPTLRSSGDPTTAVFPINAARKDLRNSRDYAITPSHRWMHTQRYLGKPVERLRNGGKWQLHKKSGHVASCFFHPSLRPVIRETRLTMDEKNGHSRDCVEDLRVGTVSSESESSSSELKKNVGTLNFDEYTTGGMGRHLGVFSTTSLM